MPKLTKVLKLPVKLVELAKQHFKTSNATQAICNCIQFTIMHCLLTLSSEERFEIYHLLDIEERRTLKNYSVRIEDYTVNALKSVFNNQPLSAAVKDVMALTLSTADTVSMHPSKLINILGSKWDKRMQSAIKQVVANRKWEKSYETCVGALGIHANFNLADTELINDDDIDKINLYRCIQKYAFEFKAKALIFGCTESDFTEKKNTNYSSNDFSDVDRAVGFFILNFFSVRNSGHTYISKSKQAFFKRLEVIAPLSKRMHDVHITNDNLFEVLEKHKNETHALFIVDPIYLDTNVYKSRTLDKEKEHDKEFGWDKHLRLAKELRSIKGDFIYFCRITASRHKNRQNKLIDTPETLHLKDIEMQGRIDDLYWGYGFYYIDVPLDNGTIERIITSFEFEGSTLYGSLRGEN